MYRKLLLAGGLLAIAPGAQAHHSRAMFDLLHPVTLSGTVRQFQWTNPHCYIQLSAENGKGEVEQWSVEMGPPHSLMERGWGKFSLKPGDQVKITVAPLRTGGRVGELEGITRLDGKPIGRAL